MLQNLLHLGSPQTLLALTLTYCSPISTVKIIINDEEKNNMRRNELYFSSI